jgi:hypothetical protein
LPWFPGCLLASLCAQTRRRERIEESRSGCIIEVKEALAGVAGVSSNNLRMHGRRKDPGVGFIGESAMDFGWAPCAHNGDGIGSRRSQLSDLADKKIAARLYLRGADLLRFGKNGRNEMGARMTVHEIGPSQPRHARRPSPIYRVEGILQRCNLTAVPLA